MSEGPFRPRGREPGEDVAPGAPEETERPEPPPPPGPPPGIASQATWILGVVIVLALAYITVNTLTTDQPGSRGVQPGTELPPFAAPLVPGPVEGDANVLLKARDGVPKACDVRGPGIFNVCEAVEEGPLVLGFLAAPSQQCVAEVDVLDEVAGRFPDVTFAVVAIRGDRDEVRDLVAERGWEVPVAYDRDGAVSNAYGIAVCPTVTFVREGGDVAETLLGAAGPDEIAAQVREIAE